MTSSRGPRGQPLPRLSRGSLTNGLQRLGRDSGRPRVPADALCPACAQGSVSRPGGARLWLRGRPFQLPNVTLFIRTSDFKESKQLSEWTDLANCCPLLPNLAAEPRAGVKGVAGRPGGCGGCPCSWEVVLEADGEDPAHLSAPQAV